MNVLVLTTSFPHSKEDFSGKFIKDQILNILNLNIKFNFYVLTGSKTKFNYKNQEKFKVYIFRYFFKKFEILGNEAIKLQIQKNKKVLFLIPFYFFSQFVNTIYILKKQNIDLIYVHWFFPQALTAYIVNKFMRIPYKITIHSSEINYFIKYFGKIGKIISKNIILNSSGVSVTSDTIYKNLEQILTKDELSKLRILIFPMGINSNVLDKIETKKTVVKIPESRKNILFIGRLVEKKGLFILIEFFKKFVKSNNTYNLIIAGDGELKKEVELYLNEYDLKNKIFLTGSIDDEQKKYLFEMSEILIVPSIITDDDIEGMPVVIIEGLYFGKIVIASQFTNSDLVISDNINGFKFNALDSNNLLKVFEKILRLDPLELSNVKLNAKLSSKKFSSLESAKVFVDFLNN